MGILNFFRRKVKQKNNALRQPTYSKPISELKEHIKGFGDPKHPFLHKKYSPSSRVPCIDFTGFIVERLRQTDIHSISTLMRGILETNPGLGTGPEWIDEKIESVVNAPFDKYLSYAEGSALFELKAMWILSEKGGGGREFWIAESSKLPLMFSRALCCYHLNLLPSFIELLQKSNAAIKKWGKDSDYWKDCPLFKPDVLRFPDLGENQCRHKILSLSISARLHLFQAITSGGGSLPKLTDFNLRSFGLHIPLTTKEILDSELLIPTDESAGLLGCFSKSDIISICEEKGIGFRKSWNKTKLLKALEENDPDFIQTTMREQNIVSINPEFKEDLLSIYAYSNKLENIYKMLCFI